MNLQDFLIRVFEAWSPPAPEVVDRTKSSITLNWENLEVFHFLAEDFLYRIEKSNKIPKWIVIYSGGKTTKKIDNLAPCHPHKFRLKIILKAEAVPCLALKVVQHYCDEETIFQKMTALGIPLKLVGGGDVMDYDDRSHRFNNLEKVITDQIESKLKTRVKWMESSWSDETWTNTDTDGTSAVCFSMAVRCGYLKQVQMMLEERPDLIGILNTNNGFTPLATAVRKGDVSMVRFLLLAGADVNQQSSTGQTALHLAILSAKIQITELLIERGADFKDRDLNGLRAEHYAVDSCDLEMLKFILDKGGDVTVEDSNGWTPLFRALCQGAKTEIIQELINRGSNVEVKDRAGLPLTSVARLLKIRHRDSILRLVDSSYPHEKAVANFTRLTKKVYNVHSMVKIV
ncbi:hypothetical protein K1T71_013437 [Dendrolimus kikuchii]|uniref:Uncharacterized protein n=1 Tax=Dendrolimus kikuchii TaxID=765133 RepID=A0ACC1CGN0_9NEOP|nr:hypothetical protein K1T71_013437 [Dendrolimus kikuchii]